MNSSAPDDLLADWRCVRGKFVNSRGDVATNDR